MIVRSVNIAKNVSLVNSAETSSSPIFSFLYLSYRLPSHTFFPLHHCRIILYVTWDRLLNTLLTNVYDTTEINESMQTLIKFERYGMPILQQHNSCFGSSDCSKSQIHCQPAGFVRLNHEVYPSKHKLLSSIYHQVVPLSFFSTYKNPITIQDLVSLCLQIRHL